MPFALGTQFRCRVKVLLVAGQLHFTPNTPAHPWENRRLLGRFRAARGSSPTPTPGLRTTHPSLLPLTRFPEDVGSGTYTGLCVLALGSVFETLPLSRRNLDFTQPILWQREGR